MGIKAFYKQLKEQTLFNKVMFAIMLVALLFLCVYIAINGAPAHFLRGLL